MNYLKKIILISLLLPVSHYLTAQARIEGHVMTMEDGAHIPLEKAQVFWLESQTGTLSDAEGHFSIEQKEGDKQLVVRMAGYDNDTLLVTEKHLHIMLQPATLDDVEISRRQKGTRVSSIDPTSTQLINSLELTKAACCNLSETFETNATVDVAYSDAVTGAKRIKMLGLDGIYTQILNENYPAIRGLVQSYGLTYIPGPFLSGIQVSKGAASVQNGYESLAGEINVEYIKPQNADPLFVNLYTNSLGRQEANIALSHRFSPFFSGMVMAHGSRNPRRFDNNSDGLLTFLFLIKSLFSIATDGLPVLGFAGSLVQNTSKTTARAASLPTVR
ncbi:MAG: carboxypeptidase-like regulatory domain-containing protein [Bacteroidia bacterium]